MNTVRYSLAMKQYCDSHQKWCLQRGEELLADCWMDLWLTSDCNNHFFYSFSSLVEMRGLLGIAELICDAWGTTLSYQHRIIIYSGRGFRVLPCIVPSPGSGPAASTAKPKGSNPFGEARPREEVLAEKGQDWKKIDEQLDSMKIKEVGEKAEGGSSFGNRSFGIGNGRSSDHTEMSWRKPDTTEDDASSHSAEPEKDEGGPAEEN
ncbi:hypothetical protein L484_024960 [Morus notabilis]|uniref:Uncharacterized protein n=1 Tax=Morus notabilis TaxID=981085 RepID=W9QKJ1_9ROSA|nr:hypothetical protein L484_024960 [Morus notabilis]